MSEWEPQWVVTLFFALGILFSVSGALWIEKRVEKIRSRRRRNPSAGAKGNGKNFSPDQREKSSPSRGSHGNWTPEQDHL
ncbi:hypothetical protein ACFQ49_15440 [Kroppenstedtia eburnea]|uniref:Uncharacterized protein n=1 Tax=Kroppenstedtia eburnea TaxID=714067 RepID=A0A1N7NMG2_9BACL|nr:hypothetical protein [Kroppenstedtia eburnea]EGK08935.1 hypothetical protein HMPREF9374_3175 [Desmospora sp. 8437]QKI81026.1 hypothetical protein GXN75_02890 [Kroppenstedtia eburnea]SIS99477.1 hypothetical protein SAMN05421790_109102 [Kroppenstedtia eburnea]